MASTNGGLKVTTYVLSGLVIGLVLAVVTAYTQGANHISRLEAQVMVDRGDDAIKNRLERIESKLDDIDKLIRQGQSP